MEKVEPTPEAHQEISASSAELLPTKGDERKTHLLKTIGKRAAVAGLIGAGIGGGIVNHEGVTSHIGPLTTETHLIAGTSLSDSAYNRTRDAVNTLYSFTLPGLITADPLPEHNPKSSLGITSAPASVRLNDVNFIPSWVPGHNALQIGAFTEVKQVSDDRTDETSAAENSTAPPDAPKTDPTDYISMVAKQAGVIGDPEAIKNQIKHEYIHEITKGVIAGGLASIALTETFAWVAQQKRRRKFLAGAATLSTFAGIGASLTPTYDYNSIAWRHSVIALGGTTTDISYSGIGADILAQEASINEAYANTIEKNTLAALKPVRAEDTLVRPKANVMMVYSDWHCNANMARTLAASAKLMKAKITVNIGDNNFGGTSIESMCEQILGYNMTHNAADKPTNYYIPGNHDPDALINVAKDSGFKIVDGKTVSVYGASLYGKADPTISPAGSDDLTLRNPDYTVDDFKKDSTNDICKIHPAIVAIHEPQETTEKALRCSTLMMHGHTHVLTPLEQPIPDHYTINDGTAGGAAPNRQSLAGTLGKEASYYYVYLEDGKVTGVRYVTIQPNTTAKASEFMGISRPDDARQSALNTPLSRHLPGYAASGLLTPAA